MKRFGKPVLAVVFVALLATPFLMRRYGPRAEVSAHADVDARAHYGFRLTESSKAAGLTFVHEAPMLDAKLAHIMPQVASMGASVSIVDVDADGRPDIYVTNSREGSKNRLYRNKGDGTFEDVAERLGIADLNQAATGVSMGAVWGDFDNDGYEDLLLYRWGRTELLRNHQGQTFTPVAGANLPAWANINSAIWLDYDRDGRLDLFLGGYYPEDVNLWKLADTKIMPESFEYANNGGRKYLYRNLGGGRFEEVSERAGLSSRRWTLAAVAADLRGSGYPDIFVANDYGVSELFVNEGGRFREVGRETGVGYAPKSGMNASVGDVFNSGRFAIYVSNISEEGILLQGNNLWVPAGGESGLPRYENMARAMGVDLGGWSFGAQFGDLNNDGLLDLYLVNGYVSASRQESYWYDYSKIAGANQLVISDAKNWPAMGDRSLAGYQPKKVWMNDGAGRFVDVAPMVGVTDRYDGRAVALADLSGRGALDVLVANQKGPLLLYRNDVAPDRNWIGFALEGSCTADGDVRDAAVETPRDASAGTPRDVGAGTPRDVGAGTPRDVGAGLVRREGPLRVRPTPRCSNRSAIGAQVTIHWSSTSATAPAGHVQRQVQEVSGGSAFCSQNQRALHFGLGTDATVEKAVVRWPSGRVDEIVRPAVNRVHTVEESL